MMSTDAATQPNPQVTRKGVRKGTSSCYECRIRKIRCIFAKDATIREGCISRGKKCTEQRRELLQETALDNGESLRARVARLEAIIQSSNTDIETVSDVPRNAPSPSLNTESPLSSINNLTLDASISINKASLQSIDPIVTLLNYAIVGIAHHLWEPRLLIRDAVETTTLWLNP